MFVCLRYIANNMTLVCLMIMVVFILSFTNIGDFDPRFLSQQPLLKDPVPERMTTVDLSDRNNFYDEYTTAMTSVDIDIDTSEELYEDAIKQFSDDISYGMSSVSTGDVVDFMTSTNAMTEASDLELRSTTLNSITLSEGLSTRRQLSQETSMRKIFSYETSGVETFPQETSMGQTLSEQTSVSHELSEETIPRETFLKESSLSQISSIKTSPGQTLTKENTSTEQTLLKETSMGQTLPEETSVSQKSSEETLPGQTLLKESSPSQLPSIKTSSGQTLTKENTSTDQTLLEEPLVKKSKAGEVAVPTTLEEPWLLATEQRLSERLHLLKENCIKYHEDLGHKSSIRHTIKRRLYFVNNLLTCLIAKVGTTTWMTHLLALAGAEVNLDVAVGRQGVHSVKSHKKISAKQSLSEEQLDELMILESSYNQRQSKLSDSTMSSTTSTAVPSTGGGPRTKHQGQGISSTSGGSELPSVTLQDVVRVITVRPPLERLVSAYREKFLGGNKFILGEDKYNYNYFHKPLLKSNNITANIGDAISFSFTQYLTHITKKNNNHWRSYLTTCSPCRVAYDHILHLDTFDDDLRYVYRQVGIDPSSDPYLGAVVHKTEGSKPPANFDHYFKNQPEHLLRDLYRVYRMDFILFGYNIPKYLMKFEKEYSNHVK